MENSRAIKGVITVVAGLTLAMMVIMNVMSGRGNALGNLAFYLGIGSMVLGIVSPRTAIYWLVILTAFSDMIKRLMVLYGSISGIDLIYVLAPAPITVVAIMTGTLIQWLLGRVRLTWLDFWLFVAACAACLLVLVKSLAAGAGAMGVLRAGANAGAFAFLLPIVNVHLKQREQMLGFLKFVVLVFVPVAIYGIWQGINGYSDFELEYLAAGWSIEVRQLNYAIPRPFSTLNSARSLTIIMALCAGICVLLGVAKKGGKFSGAFSPVNLALSILFITAMIFTLTRAGWLAFAVMMFAAFMLRSGFRTALMYAGGVALILSLYIFSEPLLKFAERNREATRGFESDFASQALFIGTWQDRLVGFHNLMTNPELRTAFGVDQRLTDYHDEVSGGGGSYLNRRTDYFVHDALSAFIVKNGFVPFTVLVIVLAFVLFKVHRRLLRAREPTERGIDRWLLAMLFGVFASGITSSMAFSVFPVNAYFYIIAGLLISRNFGLQKAQKPEAEAARDVARLPDEALPA